MSLSDFDEALLELAVKRGALTGAGADRVRGAIGAAAGTSLESALASLIDAPTFQKLCEELPDFYARRQKAKKKVEPREEDELSAAARWFEEQSEPSATIGPYLVEEELGAGGIGVVYRVVHESSKKAYALKLLNEASDAVESRRFLREARAIAKVDHPNVVKIVDVGESAEKRLYYVMELIEGVPLLSLGKGRPADVRAIAVAMRDVLSGLSAIHAQGILHRDVKPQNVLVDRCGRALIIDFSVARVPDASLTLTRKGFSVGTPVYMAPEQIRDEPVGPATDLYALGVTAWHVLEGRTPYDDAENYDQIAKAKLDRPPPPFRRKDVPIWLSRFVLRLMARDPKDRFASAAEALSALEKAQEQRYCGNYEVLEELGRGAGATVYRARDEAQNVFALKVLDRGAKMDAMARLTRESRALSRIEHENVVRLFDGGIAEGRSFLTLEWLDGGTLETLCARGPLPLEAVLSIGIQIARGLAAAHARGVIHRDLKPENVLLSSAGDAKIVDFGLALIEGDSEPETQAFVGTPAYSSPEQCRGESATRRSDLYSLGAVLFRIAAGRKPFSGESSTAVATKHLREAPPALEQVAPAAAPLAPVVAGLLEKDPERRYKTADDVARDLERIASSKPKTSRPWWRVF